MLKVIAGEIAKNDKYIKYVCTAYTTVLWLHSVLYTFKISQVIQKLRKLWL